MCATLRTKLQTQALLYTCNSAQNSVGWLEFCNGKRFRVRFSEAHLRWMHNWLVSVFIVAAMLMMMTQVIFYCFFLCLVHMEYIKTSIYGSRIKKACQVLSGIKVIFFSCDKLVRTRTHSGTILLKFSRGGRGVINSELLMEPGQYV